MKNKKDEMNGFLSIKPSKRLYIVNDCEKFFIKGCVGYTHNYKERRDIREKDMLLFMDLLSASNYTLDKDAVIDKYWVTNGKEEFRRTLSRIRRMLDSIDSTLSLHKDNVMGYIRLEGVAAVQLVEIK